jgi:hypothetical protein
MLLTCRKVVGSGLGVVLQGYSTTDFVGPTLSSQYGLLDFQSGGTWQQWTILRPFIGRYVGFAFSGYDGTAELRVYSFDVYGQTV